MPKATPKDQATGRRIERVVLHAAAHWTDALTLDDLARVAGLSRFHFDRVFRAWVGLPPLRFVQMLKLAEGKAFLAGGRSLLDTSMKLGLSGPSRLHDLFVTIDAVTPGDFKAQGQGLRVGWGSHPTALGRCFIGLSPRGVCFLSFVTSDAEGLRRLRQTWPAATLAPDPAGTARVARLIFESAFASSARKPDAPSPIAVHVRGTNFQTKVWSALLAIPRGAVASYGDVARAIGNPNATRAVGTACGANPVPILIPCHRVIRDTGALGNYGLGLPRKRALLAYEAAAALP